MHDEMDQILQDCLERIEKEGATIEGCLALYPQHQEELRELLVLFTSLRNMDRVTPSKEFSVSAPSQLIAKLPAQQITLAEKFRRFFQPNFQMPHRQMALARVFITLAIIIILGTSAVYAADSAGPGDLLYQLDRSIEQIRLRLTTDPQETAKIRLANATERLEEAAESIERGQLENSKIALEAYQFELDQLSPLMAQTNNQNQLAIEAMISEGLAIHEETLRRLMNSAPQDALDSIQNAINASRKGIDSSEGPKELPTQNQNEDAPQGPAEDAPQGPSDNTPVNPSADPPQGPKEDPPQNPTKETPTTPSEDASQSPTGEAPQNPSETTPQGPSEDAPQEPNEDAPQGPDEDAPQEPQEKTPQGSMNENHAKP